MNENKTNINWYPGHMAKTKRLIRENYNLIDIVYEVIDARIPYSSKIKDIYDVIVNKPKLIIMTKKDLCDINVTKTWIKYYENLGSKVVLADLNNPDDIKKIIEETIELTKKMQDKRESKGLKEKEIRALVVGIPNVGKSTLINRLCGRKAAQTGNNPGVTKNITWLNTGRGILLMDTPGILWPKIKEQDVAYNLASFQAIKEEIIPEGEVAVYILTMLSKYYKDILFDRFGLKEFKEDEVVEGYEVIAKKIGAMQRGEPDYTRISKRILNDIRNEYIKGITFDRNLDHRN